MMLAITAATAIALAMIIPAILTGGTQMYVSQKQADIAKDRFEKQARLTEQRRAEDRKALEEQTKKEEAARKAQERRVKSQAAISTRESELNNLMDFLNQMVGGYYQQQIMGNSEPVVGNLGNAEAPVGGGNPMAALQSLDPMAQDRIIQEAAGPSDSFAQGAYALGIPDFVETT